MIRQRNYRGASAHHPGARWGNRNRAPGRCAQQRLPAPLGSGQGEERAGLPRTESGSIQLRAGCPQVPELFHSFELQFSFLQNENNSLPPGLIGAWRRDHLKRGLTPSTLCANAVSSFDVLRHPATAIPTFPQAGDTSSMSRARTLQSASPPSLPGALTLPGTAGMPSPCSLLKLSAVTSALLSAPFYRWAN